MKTNYGITAKYRSVFFAMLLFITAMLALPSAGSCASVLLTWDPSNDADLAGYKVYYQANSSALPFKGVGASEGSAPVDVANTTTSTVDGLDPGNSYYFAVTAYNSTGLESVYSNIILIPESVPPVATITSPANNAQVNGLVSINVNASDNVGVTSVQFYVNGVLQETGTAAPFVFSWNTSTLAGGSYTLSAHAFDAAGNVGQSEVVVTVGGDTVPPTASLTLPGSNAPVSGNVTVTASASDNTGVTRIEVYDNGTLAFASNQNPASFTWNTVLSADGSHTLIAKAYDAAGNIGQSTNLVVSVANVLVDRVAPVVNSFSMPAVINSTKVTVSSFSATDNVGVTGYLITESAFAPAASAAGWTLSAPTSFSCAGTGSRTVYAWAKDAAGNVSASSSQTILIDTTLPVIKSVSLNSGKTSLTIKASASDNTAVARMQIYVDSVLQLETSTNAITSVWQPTYQGVHTVIVKAFDAAGNVRSQTLAVNK